LAQRLAVKVVSMSQPGLCSQSVSSGTSTPAQFVPRQSTPDIAFIATHSRTQSLIVDSRQSFLPSTPSTRATSLAPSDTSYPTRAPSLAPSIDVPAANLPHIEVMEALLELPVHLAPRLGPAEPLSGPLYPPERINPPAPGESRRRARLQLKDLIDADKTIISTVLSRFEALIATHDLFPNDATARQHANVYGCKQSGKTLLLSADSEYEQLVRISLTSQRSRNFIC
jgi:hypothetical protein